MVLSVCAVRYTFGIALGGFDHAKAGVAFDLAAMVTVDGAHVLVMMIGWGVEVWRMECDGRTIGRAAGTLMIIVRVMFVVVVKSWGRGERVVVVSRVVVVIFVVVVCVTAVTAVFVVAAAVVAVVVVVVTEGAVKA